MLVKRLDRGDVVIARQAITTLKTETPPGVRANLEVEYLKDFLSCDTNYLLVALIDGEPVAYVLAYRLMRVDREQDMMLFYEVIVDEKFRHQGVGRALIMRLKEICRDKKIMKMWVLTDRSNIAAVALYKSTGGIEDRHGDELTFTYLPPYE